MWHPGWLVSSAVAPAEPALADGPGGVRVQPGDGALPGLQAGRRLLAGAAAAEGPAGRTDRRRAGQVSVSSRPAVADEGALVVCPGWLDFCSGAVGQLSVKRK